MYESSSSFSPRNGFRDRSSDADPLIYNEAPRSLRRRVMLVLECRCDKTISWIRAIVSDALLIRMSEPNWHARVDPREEVESHLYQSEWFKFYDFIEACAVKIKNNDPASLFAKFINETNQLLEEERIGWRLNDAVLEFHGDQPYEDTMKSAETSLSDLGHNVAYNELREARDDLSRRPSPDLSGAIHHAMAALECVARTVCKNSKPTLGEVIKQNPDLFPLPVGDAVSKLWGYSSEHARHGNESRKLGLCETQLVVGICAVMCSYLSESMRSKTTSKARQ